MDLGCFSVSLTVKDIKASRAFYEKLGFIAYHDSEAQGWLILKNGNTKIGLFQGMFEKNMLTFNPGWDGEANTLKDFTDVRDIQKQLKKDGIEIASEVDETGSGPGSFMVIDPDGNPILIDQHV
jgi:catechol 2,3-dioxygenase-like lactoylglutathione lyase family enzyme